MRLRLLRWHASHRLVELAVGSRPERGAHERDGSRLSTRFALKRTIQKACALQLAITAGRQRLLARVNGTIDLDDEPDAPVDKTSFSGSAFFGERVTAFADATGDKKADAIADNNGQV